MSRRWITLLIASTLTAYGQRPASSEVKPSRSGPGSLATARTELTIPSPPLPKVAPTPGPNTFKPTWETQKGARTYMLGIPAPRGQIVDRNGLPLAQTRVSYNLGLSFPTPLNFSETEALLFAQKQVTLARSLTGRPISLTQDQVLKHYK